MAWIIKYGGSLAIPAFRARLAVATGSSARACIASLLMQVNLTIRHGHPTIPGDWVSRKILMFLSRLLTMNTVISSLFRENITRRQSWMGTDRSEERRVGEGG